MGFNDKKILEDVRSMDEYEFEEFVADLWEKQGWNTTVTSGSGDRGIDVIAEKETPFYQKQLIQAKRYSSNTKVGGPDIQQYSSLRRQIDDVDSVIVVTTGSFTSQAQDTASNLNVKTIDGRDLVSLIDEVGANDVIDEYTGQTGGSKRTNTNRSKTSERASSNENNRSNRPSFKNTEQYSDDIRKSLNEIVQKTRQKPSKLVSGMVCIDGYNVGYHIHPYYDDLYNVHFFSNTLTVDMDQLNEYDKGDRHRIIQVAKRNNFELQYSEDKEINVIAGQEEKTLNVDEIKRSMEDFLSGVFHVSTDRVGVVIYAPYFIEHQRR